jgi:hypothetical protein
MAVTSAATGTQATAQATDHVVSTQAGGANGNFMALYCDATNIPDSDQLLLTVELSPDGGTTWRALYYRIPVQLNAPAAAGEPFKDSPPVRVPNGWSARWTLRREGGATARNVPWYVQTW